QRTTAELSTLSLHDALPIFAALVGPQADDEVEPLLAQRVLVVLEILGRRRDDEVAAGGAELERDDPRERELGPGAARDRAVDLRSEEHTSELQSRENLVCRL